LLLEKTTGRTDAGEVESKRNIDPYPHYTEQCSGLQDLIEDLIYGATMTATVPAGSDFVRPPEPAP
jgi:hypothetical protein